MDAEVKHFSKNNIIINPGGRWEIVKGKKRAIDAMRPKNAQWNSYPNDNMGRHFLEKEQNILVVDLDGAELIEDKDGNYYIEALDLTLPKTLKTTTSTKDKHHIYYHIPDSSLIGNRMIGVVDKIDFFTYGFIFDMHQYAKESTCNMIDIQEASPQLLNLAIEYTDEKKVPTQKSHLAPTSNIQRYNLIEAYLSNNLTTVKSWNAFFRIVFPKEYIKKGANHLKFENFKLSYDLINKIAVKLTTTSELGFKEHTIPVLNSILSKLGADPKSKKTEQLLHRQILPSLPQHEPEKPYMLQDDALTIIEHINNQDTATPIFRVIMGGKAKFIQLNRFSLEPIEHNGEYLFDDKVAKFTNPERLIYNEAGKVIGWDDQVPIVYITDSPYDEQVVIDEENSRNIINLYKRTRYLKEATPRSSRPDNLIMKLLESSIHPEYLTLVLNYHAHIVFGQRPPTMVLWIASLKSDKGGTGKSIITIDLLSRILGTAGAVISEEDMAGNWGDVLVGARCLSLEDLPTLATQQFNKLYASIKQATSSAQKRLNMKGMSFRTERIKISITGSSNERLALHPSDRRFLCLEPAHLRGHTEALSAEMAMKVEDFRSSDEHSEELQDYTNYLLHLYQQPLTLEMKTHLFISPPETVYRQKWIATAQSNTANIITFLNTPRALHDTVRVDDMNIDNLIELYSLVVSTFKENTQKTAVPWNWFGEILPYIQSHKEGAAQSAYSKSQVAKMLNVDFTPNVGTAYNSEWSRKWKDSGYVFSTTQETIDEYKNLIKELYETENTTADNRIS